MRTLIAGFGMVCIALLLVAGTNSAQDKKAKEVVLKGKVACAKCELSIATECETVIVVKDAKSKKDIIYYFDKDSHGKFHDDICAASKAGSVTGTVKNEGKKKIVSVKKVTYE